MKITERSLQIASGEIPWEEVKGLKLRNRDLTLVQKRGGDIEIPNLSLHQIDSIFRAYESYLLKQS